MPLIYNPQNWYWRSEDDKLYSSKDAQVINRDNPDYVTWAEHGGIPTVWPKDEEGNQTQEALDKVIAAHTAPQVTYKADIWRRCTDDEAKAIEEALSEAPVRQRKLFEDAMYLDPADEAFAFARAALTKLFTKKRADELLAPSKV